MGFLGENCKKKMMVRVPDVGRSSADPAGAEFDEL
jgi:hypothetical protein